MCCGYHGWQDWFIGTTTRNKGVPNCVKKLTHPFKYNDIETFNLLLKKYSGKIAGIIIEPIGLEKPTNNFLNEIRKQATKNNIVLIFDECWTGFRISEKGSYGKFGISPDLACFGKALGNGVPISVILGHKSIMKVFEDIFFSFTFGGDALGMTAAITVLDIIKKSPCNKTYRKNWKCFKCRHKKNH